MKTVLVSVAALLISSAANAEGKLNIFNFGNYTSPELIKKFETKYDVQVTITDYDTNDTALAKVRQGGHGFDVVVPSSQVMPIWISEGLLLESRPHLMENFSNVDPKWIDVGFDPGRRYSVPWQWGTAGVIVNTSVYSGDINTSAIFLDPPAELAGKINVVPEMSDVMYLAIKYAGGEPCTGDMSLLKKVRDILTNAKPKWISIDYGNNQQYSSGDVAAGFAYNGAAFRSRLLNPAIHFGYPKEGYPIWMDNAAILKDAKNVENAKLFLNFIMAPENAALLSSFARYANGIKGSEAFMPEDMQAAPEIVIPEGFKAQGKFSVACPPDIQAVYTKIWVELLK
ncbi:putrescine/spermidine ABC transporter substrate-binding protein [Mesorhizobium loti]|nr:extracellular solute-binding protein [Mesorhizobium loti]PLP55596.1 putrescine/spermidine ABC transporter substrate-binding protein [Mesorhizobium loti]